MTDKIRQFDSGATRDTDAGKLDYEGFLNPLVLKRYAEYLDKHRVQSDGNLRDSDNWQGLFGEKHFSVCMKSGFRHFMAWWLEHRGHKTENGIEDAICGIMFNAQAYLLKLLKDKNEKKFVCPARWEIELESGCGWFVSSIPKMYLHKNLTLHSRDTGWVNHKYGEAPGYWPTKKAAENALQQYLEKEKS